jgi:hypothetical protein
MPTFRFRIRGVVRERETGRPLAELVVRAYDKDLIFDDVLGFASTDQDGGFSIAFSTEDFKDLWEDRPDIYVRVFDRQGLDELCNTRDRVRKNAGDDEFYELEVPASRLGGAGS